MANVFITGATGYMGRALIPELLARGHRVRALVRSGAERKLAPGAIAVPGDALAPESVRAALEDDDVLVHLVGVAHPSPMMKSYIEARSKGEALIRSAQLNATVLRLWYVPRPRPPLAHRY